MPRANSIALTKGAIKAAKPGWTSFEPRGLYLRVTPSSRAFYLRFKKSGRWNMVRLCAGDLNPEDVRELALARLAAIAKGDDPFDRTTTATLADVCADHAKRLVLKGKGDPGKEYARTLGKLGKLRPGEVTGAHVVDWFDKLTSLHGPTAANRARSMVLAALRASGQEFSEQAWRSAKPNKESPRERVLSDAETAAVFKVLESRPLRERAFFQVLFRTSLRKGELRSALRKNLDLAAGTLTIDADRRRKNGKAHTVHLDATCVRLLKELKLAMPWGPYVFPSRVHGRHFKNVDAPWDGIRTEAGCPDVTIHDIRRSAATRAALAGHTAEQIAALLGNTKSVAAEHYVQLANRPDVIKSVASAVTSSLDKVAK